MDPTKLNTFEACGGAVNQRGSGADISPLMRQGVPGIGLVPESQAVFRLSSFRQ